MVLLVWTLSSAVALSLACGPVQDSNMDACSSQADCGGPGSGICVSEECIRFGENTGYAKALIALSFGRDMYQSAASGYLYFLHDKLADGSSLTCEQLLSSEKDVISEEMNRLTVEPKYLVFNWSHGGTYFPNNLVQFIRPSASALVFVEGFSQLNGQGTKTSVGCTDGIVFRTEQTSELTVQIKVP